MQTILIEAVALIFVGATLYLFVRIAQKKRGNGTQEND